MNSRDLMRAAFRRQPADRIPTMPQTLRDVAVHIYEQADGFDWIEGIKRCLENPALSEEYVIRLSRDTGCDGLRLHVRPDPLAVRRAGDELFVVDPQSGDVTGRVDLHGGGGIIPNQPEPPVETLDDVRTRLQQQVDSFSDEKIEYLRAARARVPDLFVAVPPGGITMNTYTVLRGRTQAMMDFFDRPDFVHAAMELQAEAVIRKAEKLLRAGIDAFYIGDPTASASLISPRHFEEFCLPAYQIFCRHFKNTDILIYIHVCGNSAPLLEMLADSGAHVVEPLDPLGGVSVADAKRRIGHRVALMGGVNTLTLATGTADEVRAEAIRKCREGGPQGYILAAGDMVPPRTPLANLQALVDVARYRQYANA
jgi:uroporphyrinogen decarboxylase